MEHFELFWIVSKVEAQPTWEYVICPVDSDNFSSDKKI